MTDIASAGPAAAGTTAPRQPPGVATDHPPRRGSLPLVLTGVFITTLDFFIVNVAIPSVQRDLHAGSAAVQWVVAGYGLAYGAGLITGGRLGDIYGRQRMFALGLTLFTLASAACGLAPGTAALLAGRVAQGLAAALLAPQVLGILNSAYTGPARARAFNAYGITMGLAAVFGQLVGGLLIRADLLGLGWRTCFLINIPIGVGVLALTRRLVPRSPGSGRARLDAAGTVLVTVALVAVVLPLIEGRTLGWPPYLWVCLAASVPLFGAFAWWQRRLAARGGAPLVAPVLFGERAFTIGLAVQLVFWMGMASFFLVFALYLQRGLGLDALGAGLVFVPMGAGYMVTSTLGGRLARGFGRQVIAVGALTVAVSDVLLQAAAAHIGLTGRVGLLVPALALAGAGMGMGIAPLAAIVLARVSPHRAGAASGVLTTCMQLGNAVGVAVIGIVFYGALGRSDGPGAYPHAFRAALFCLGAVAVVTAVLTQLLPSSAGLPAAGEPDRAPDRKAVAG